MTNFTVFSQFTKIRNAAFICDKLTGRLAAHLSHKRIEFKTTNPKSHLLQIRLLLNHQFLNYSEIS